MPSFIGTIVTRLLSAAAALCVVFLVLIARVVAYVGTYAVAFLARHAGTVSPFATVKPAPIVATVKPAKVLDSAPLMVLVNARIPSAAERASAKKALDDYLA